MVDILDPSAVLSRLVSLLPESSTLNSPQDGLVALIHSCMTILSFRLVGIDDSNTTNVYENNVLPSNWNSNGPGSYTLRCRHEQSSLEFILKVSKLGSRTVINAIAAESDKTATLDIQTADYTSASFYPYTVGGTDAQPLVHGFISSHRVKDFIDAFKLKIIQKLIPGLRKEGYSETSEESSSQSSQAQPRPQAPRAPSPPYPVHNPFGEQRGPFGARNPLEIGRSDLDPIPLGPNPFRPGPIGGPSRGDGMFVGPNHPMFSDRFTPGRGGGIGGAGHHEGPWGGDGFLPPMGAPPGARFDPIAPVRPPFGPGGGGRPGGIGRPGGRAPPRSGEPDNDEFMPPGMGSDMYM